MTSTLQSITSENHPTALIDSEVTISTFVRPEGTLAYTDSGTGPLIVALPSMGDVQEEYRYLVPILVQAGYRVVTVDLRGHGNSSAGWASYTPEAVGDDIIALIRHLNAGPAIVIGESFTAGSAVWAATEAPEMVDRLVLSGPFVRDIPQPLHQKLLLKVMLGVLLHGPWKVSAWVSYYRTLYPTRQPVDLASYTKRLGDTLRQPGRMAAVQAMASASKSKVGSRLRDVKQPVLVVMGSKDPDFFGRAEEEARWVAEAIHGDHVMIEGAGHYPHAEMPEAAADAILLFLNAGR